ncbi:hypothetical protein GW17_00061920 [Ensete ventricosum]|uniref:Uncharacterized protein n=1 Tax=Ensete ventricosum TaxID=4639 RepID=A0A444BUG7_ENSVE|nr:hypothetical protein GW17_00061920 [Ensete ventricosum]RZR73465.1 hypothetical protein BHM03_00024658 [Ensete ventricosum]
MRRKRKEIRSSENVGFCLSDDFDKARQIKKKCSEHWKVCPAEKVGSCSRGDEKVGSCGGGTAAGVVMTAPASGRSAADSPGRGLKRKLGCVESATRIGRKKKLENEYVLGRQIGKGRFGSVRLCWSKINGEKFACKTLLKNGEETVHREVEIMQHVSGHPGIVTLKAVFEDSKSFHLVMELCSGGRLMDQMVKEGRYSECRAAILMRELILVIKYCHEMGVVHRDIKPENILLTTSGKMKLSDFGLAVRVTCGNSGRLLDTPSSDWSHNATDEYCRRIVNTYGFVVFRAVYMKSPIFSLLATTKSTNVVSLGAENDYHALPV